VKDKVPFSARIQLLKVFAHGKRLDSLYNFDCLLALEYIQKQFVNSNGPAILLCVYCIFHLSDYILDV